MNSLNKFHLYYMLALVFLLSLASLATAQTLQQVTDNGATTANVITAAGLNANAASSPGIALPITINSLNGIRLNGTIAGDSHNGITYQSGGGGGAAIGFYRGGSYDTNIDFYTNLSGGFGNLMHRMRISSNGYVGIGTLTPVEKLHIVEEGLLRPTFETISSENYIRPILDFSRSRGTAALKTPVVEDDKLGSIYFRGYDGVKHIESSAIGGVVEGQASYNFQKGGIYFSTNNGLDTVYNTPKMRMYISSSGNVFINPKLDAQNNVIASSIIGEGKLQVRGLIRAQEVKVEVANWPDYVFANNYSLPSLEETEKYIKEKGHLPGIPTAAEAAKNGIELGDMNKKLLQKIEELTLYLIEMKKTTDAQIADLKTEIKNLKSN